MIAEDYCSEELVKLLLEKGCPLDKVIKQDERPVYFTLPTDHPNWADCDAYYIPTHAQVMRWLREEHKIDIFIDTDFPIDRMKYTYKIVRIYKDGDKYTDVMGGSFDTYEEAVDDALKYSLENLI